MKLQRREYLSSFLSHISSFPKNILQLNCKFDSSRCFEDFEILHGDLQGLTDTMDFLKSLSELNRNILESSEKQYQERTAASVLFDWEVLIWQFFVFILGNCRTMWSS